MIDSIYVASSGLSGHQKGLKVISGNVANMNTPGFKGSQAQFADVFLSHGGDAATGDTNTSGGGLDTLAPTINFSAGEIRETGRDLDMALNGPGFFVVRNDRGESLYTKSGRFEMNADGRLVTMDNGLDVMGLSGGASLTPIDLGELKYSKPEATTKVTLTGNLSSTAVVGTEPGRASVDVTVYDKLGGAHVLKLNFTTMTAPGEWNLKVMEGTQTRGEGTVRLIGRNPDPAASLVTAQVTAGDGSTDAFDVLLGDQVTGDSGGSASSITKLSVDGNTAGTITKTVFDDTGTLVITYSNTLSTRGPQLAIAEFVSPDVLSAVSGALFEYQGNDPLRLIAAGHTTQLKGGSLELSNIDLTDQFSNMILVQRGFQASSQVLSTASEMIQALYEMKSRR